MSLLKKNQLKQFVIIDGTKYPVIIEGSGEIPCVCIGLGTLMQRSLSMQFKHLFTVYSFDLYFSENKINSDLTYFTMEKIVHDYLKAIQQLHLVKPVVLAHSCFGIVSIELAKNKNVDLSGLILVASAPQWNSESINATNSYFFKHAEKERIQNDIERKQYYQSIKSPEDSELSIEKYLSDTARYWGDWNTPEGRIRALWKDIRLNETVITLFYEKILPSHNLSKDLDKVDIPIILLAGEQDYDSIPLVQWETYPKPLNFTIINCGKVGHWPNLENSHLFDQSVKEWQLKIGYGD